MGCNDVVPIKERDPVNQYFQGGQSGTISIRNRIEVPFTFHKRIARYGYSIQVVVRILQCWQGMHQVSFLNKTFDRYVWMTIDMTGVNLGEARTEPFDRLIEGLERTSFTEGKSSDVADTIFIGWFASREARRDCRHTDENRNAWKTPETDRSIFAFANHTPRSFGHRRLFQEPRRSHGKIRYVPKSPPAELTEDRVGQTDRGSTNTAR